MANIVVFLGSTRTGRQGKHVADWVVAELEAKHTVHLIDPEAVPEMLHFQLPYRYNEHPSPAFKEAADAVIAADGYVIVTPEYNHSYSGSLKNAIDCFLPEYKGKVFAIVTYSISPFGGIRAAEHLRAVVSELGCVTTPTSMPISVVHEAFKDGKLQDDAYARRFAKLMGELDWFCEALTTQRKRGMF